MQSGKRPAGTTVKRASTKGELLARARADAHDAVREMGLGNYLAADILLKLAIDQIADAGVLP